MLFNPSHVWGHHGLHHFHFHLSPRLTDQLPAARGQRGPSDDRPLALTVSLAPLPRMQVSGMPHLQCESTYLGVHCTKLMSCARAPMPGSCSCSATLFVQHARAPPPTGSLHPRMPCTPRARAECPDGHERDEAVVRQARTHAFDCTAAWFTLLMHTNDQPPARPRQAQRFRPAARGLFGAPGWLRHLYPREGTTLLHRLVDRGPAGRFVGCFYAAAAGLSRPHACRMKKVGARP